MAYLGGGPYCKL